VQRVALPLPAVTSGLQIFLGLKLADVIEQTLQPTGLPIAQIFVLLFVPCLFNAV
jgi:hypothetical protein